MGSLGPTRRCTLICTLALGLVLVSTTPLLLAQGARRSPAPAPRQERATPFKVGETLTYDVSWSNYLTAGTVVATVREKKPSYNSTAYYIVAEGRPAPLLARLYTLYYKIDTLIDAYTLLSQRGSIYSEEGTRHRLRTTLFNRETRKASFEYQSDTVLRDEFAVQPLTQDALSALYVVRAAPLKAGGTITMPVSDNGMNYNIAFDVAPPEPVAVPFGTAAAWRIKLAMTDTGNKAVGKNLAIWLSADARHLPVKVQGDLGVGVFVLSLREAR